MCRNQVFLIFANNSRFKQNKKIPNILLLKLVSRKPVRSFSKKYWTLVGARQRFQIFRQNIWFLENNRVLLHYLISISIIIKSVHKKTILHSQLGSPDSFKCFRVIFSLKIKPSNFRFRLIFIFSRRELQSYQFATYWWKALSEFLTSQTGEIVFIIFNVIIR